MIISDIMRTNVISVPSTTTLAEARRIMDAHRIRRLPVIDRNHLEGIVTIDDLDRVGPSQITTFSVNEMIYMLNKITVKDVMHRDVISVPPDTTIEEAVALAQSRRVGSLLVVENNRVIGIATTNDIFLGIFNPILGIGMPGSRILVAQCYTGPDIEKVVATINKMKVGIINLFISKFEVSNKHDLMFHLDVEDAGPVAEEIRKLGFLVFIRKR